MSQKASSVRRCAFVNTSLVARALIAAATCLGDLGRVRVHVELARRRVARGDQERLALGVLADPVRPVARPHPRRLPAAHRQLERAVVELSVVDAADPRLDPAGQPLPLLGIAGPDRRLEPVRPVVGQPHRLLGVADPHHRQRRPEGLLVHAAHRMVDVGEDGRLEEAAGGRLGALTAGDDLGALGDRVADVRLDQLELGREDDRPDVHRARGSGAPWRSASTFPVTRSRNSS